MASCHRQARDNSLERPSHPALCHDPPPCHSSCGASRKACCKRQIPVQHRAIAMCRHCATVERQYELFQNRYLRRLATRHGSPDRCGTTPLPPCRLSGTQTPVHRPLNCRDAFYVGPPSSANGGHSLARIATPAARRKDMDSSDITCTAGDASSHLQHPTDPSKCHHLAMRGRHSCSSQTGKA